MTEAPSKKTIAKGTLVAFIVAIAILFTAILPAEYGIDPLNTGAALGLTDLSEAAGASLEPAAAAVAPESAKAYRSQPWVYKVDSRELTIKPGEGIEFKYHMDKGGVMVYSWKSTGIVMFEFHGEPDKKPNKDYYDSYEKNDTEGHFRSYGSFTAPSTGVHGWYWENKGDKDVTIRLNASGFLNSARLYGPTGVRDLPVEDVK